MAIQFSLSFFLLVCTHVSPTLGQTQRSLASEERETPTLDLRTYIVHVQPSPNSSTAFTSPHDIEKWHRSFVPDAPGDARLVYSYKKVISGFAARLTDDELEALRTKDGFLHAYPDLLLAPQTTRTPAFLGLSPSGAGLWRDSGFGKGVIIGVLDTGVTPGHPSFSDSGLDPPPARWKGSCEYNASDCNNKLIGAKARLNGVHSAQEPKLGEAPVALSPPYDDNGHGTHTAGTVAGMFVSNANVDGQAGGTAAGIAPYAYLAGYKVCSPTSCSLADVKAGVEAAIVDGVDILSISIASNTSSPFDIDGLAISTFAAMGQGIFVSCAAGNDGPKSGTVDNVAPWILTVGASTMDRTMQAMVELGNGASFAGETLYQPSNFTAKQLPLVYPVAMGASDAAYCESGSLDGINIQGKVVVCDDGVVDRVAKGVTVRNAGGAAMIIANQRVEGHITKASPHVLPAAHVSYSDGLSIKAYINSDASPSAAISFKGTLVGTVPAPVVAYFSSRGPGLTSPNILKPDIIGPGVNVLAAWPTQVGLPTAASTFNVELGTSTATPHLAGVAALLKSTHPDWSPAAIKSAIMTTAYTLANTGEQIPDETLNTADLFAIGAGHVNPTTANDPGLVYDIAPEQYIAYLCSLNYNDAQVKVITQRSVSCSDYLSTFGTELNYPSFMVSLNAANGYGAQVTRNVTNVGDPSKVYSVQTTPMTGITLNVEPQQLSFTRTGENVQYTVIVTGSGSGGSGIAYHGGYLSWISSDGVTTVTSPIVVAIQ